MILEQTADEPAALAQFYELLDDRRARQAHVVATIQGHPREYKTGMQGQDPSETIHKLMPEKMTLVAYTNDPGLFLTSEESGDFPDKDRLFRPWKTTTREMITVLDQEAFDRWLAEDERQRLSKNSIAKKLFR